MASAREIVIPVRLEVSTAPEDKAEPEDKAGDVYAIIATEGEMTSDGRYIMPGAITWRDLPLSLTRNHDDDQIVGRIDEIVRTTDEGAALLRDAPVSAESLAAVADDEGTVIVGLVTFDAEGEDGADAARMVDGGFLLGVSMELGDLEDETVCVDEDCSDQIYVVHKGKIGAVTLTPFQAIEAARVITASITPPDVPPAEWFRDPHLTEWTPVTITPEGRFFGHTAPPGACHLGMEGCVTPPDCDPTHPYYHQGTVITDEGPMACGVIGLHTGHADLALSASAAQAWYDNTQTIGAFVRAGKDAYGVWFSGVLSKSVSDDLVKLIRAVGVSGDWRPINGRLELVHLLSVPAPAFRAKRAITASGEISALIIPPPQSCGGDSDQLDRIERLEAIVAALDLELQAIDAMTAAMG